jgi:hypothetical protein
VLKAEDILHQKRLDKEYLPITVSFRIHCDVLQADKDRELGISLNSLPSWPMARIANRCPRVG